MLSLLFLVLGFLLCVGLFGLRDRTLAFAAQRPADYSGKGPALDPRRDLSGPLLCEGVIYGPTGRVTSRFVADMVGRWEGNAGILTERFRYDSGAVDNREWRFQLGNDGTLHAEADDLVGSGVGKAEGSALCLRYRLRLQDDAGGHVLDVIDWMYRLENGTIINRSQFRKFGIKVAELVATLRRIET
ncbi:DUF3833 domain-containing protein [Cereibacter sphaeroides]|uniref:DUF3833 domain-containing protein n=1 Tax=Cereibacter sphaeroides TaxID=1063 RepID=UPI001F25535F|nr:DUF3833 domain-containing protein [Cereibacter sphaeroides]MCE6951130.1 DUF3833 domain-containing protein [Cereibacter sphaeroides]